MKRKFVVGITGASGSIYAASLIKALIPYSKEIFVPITENGKLILKHELRLDLGSKNPDKRLKDFFNSTSITYFDNSDMYAPVLSGSNHFDAMIIIPASMGVIGRISICHSVGVVERCADVCLKERRKLVIVPRETPYSDIHLENMLKLSRSGAHIIPASPGFYNHPKTIEDLSDFMTGKILNSLGLKQNFLKEWKEKKREG